MKDIPEELIKQLQINDLATKDIQIKGFYILTKHKNIGIICIYHEKHKKIIDIQEYSLKEAKNIFDEIPKPKIYEVKPFKHTRRRIFTMFDSVPLFDRGHFI